MAQYVSDASVSSTYAAHINQTTLSSSSHGLCGILLAASEMEAQEPVEPRNLRNSQ